ncbi:MAG: tetratricopeptide repeat protein [Planctomycetota bacterium]
MRALFLFVLLIAVAALNPGCTSKIELPLSPVSEALEADVQEHLNSTYQSLESACSDLSGDRLGQAFGDAAMTYHGYDFHRMAKFCYTRAIALSDSDPRWRYLLARVETTIGNMDKARSHLEILADREPDQLPILVALGEIQLEMESLEAAQKTFLSIISLQPRCVPAMAGLARIALRKKDSTRAIHLLEQALVLSPGATSLRYPYGIALREVGRTQEALTQLEARGDAVARVSDPWIEEIRNRPVGARIPLNRGITLFQQNFYEAAEKEFRVSVAKSPDSAAAHLNLGSTLVKLGQSTAAVTEFEEAIRLDPQSILSWFNLGVIYAEQGEDVEAIHCYDQALILNPEMVEALFNRANALRRQKRYQESAREMALVRTALPGNSLAWLAEAVCYSRIGDTEMAIDICMQGRLATGGDDRLVSLFARLQATRPDVSKQVLESVLAELDELLKRNKSLEHVESKAMVIAALGRYAEAIQWQQACIDAARNAGEKTIERRLLDNLARYREQKKAEDPWPEENSSAP